MFCAWCVSSMTGPTHLQARKHKRKIPLPCSVFFDEALFYLTFSRRILALFLLSLVLVFEVDKFPNAWFATTN